MESALWSAGVSAGVSSLQSTITAEASRAIQAEAVLGTNVGAESSSLSSVAAALQVETVRALAAEAAELTRALAVESALTNTVSREQRTRN